MSWKRILAFIAFSTVVSNVFRFDLFDHKTALEVLPTWMYILANVLLEGSGVFIGALIALSFLKKERKVETSLFGSSKSKSLIMLVIPVILISVIGVDNQFEMDSHFYGLIAVLGTLVYCIMEEYGWRGYLQEELKSFNPRLKYLIVGTVWYLWHLSFLTTTDIGDNLFFWLMMIFGSWGIGQVADSTKSILACACFHLIIQIMMFNALIKVGINGTEKLTILGISAVLWFFIVKKWERANTKPEGIQASQSNGNLERNSQT
ncbi:MAG TPA: CPBP family intramembrane metalloprotease [Flavobacteriales bacterium]|nr:CPBP family intramembrane metalloprotease [Flavobacteriales bacterium]